jgi:dipeptidyl aminopeptidase/acylaminoacyl peptidase
MKHIRFRVILLTLLLTACGLPSAAPAPTFLPAATQTDTPASTPRWAPGASPTSDPYEAYTIDHLRSRSYGGGQLEVTETLGNNGAFTRYLIRYPSDGLMMYGFMNVPNGEGPFPAVIALHGYIDPAAYNTFDYTTHYADALADAGYLVIHPNLRGYAPSDDGDNLFRVGMAIDVLNLISIVKATGGVPGALEKADPGRIGLWGHSMGGGITTRVITVSGDIRAAVLYAPMSGDEGKNYAAIRDWSGLTRGLDELTVPAEELPRISPVNFFANITAAVSIHHGMADTIIPVSWSMLTCGQLKALGKNVECHYYDDMPHTFRGQGDRDFIQSVVQFLDRYLKAP